MKAVICSNVNCKVATLDLHTSDDEEFFCSGCWCPIKKLMHSNNGDGFCRFCGVTVDEENMVTCVDDEDTDEDSEDESEESGEVICETCGAEIDRGGANEESDLYYCSECWCEFEGSPHSEDENHRCAYCKAELIGGRASEDFQCYACIDVFPIAKLHGRDKDGDPYCKDCYCSKSEGVTSRGSLAEHSTGLDGRECMKCGARFDADGHIIEGNKHGQVDVLSSLSGMTADALSKCGYDDLLKKVKE